jgi:DNA-binding transcriptional LysR family regulator
VLPGLRWWCSHSITSTKGEKWAFQQIIIALKAKPLSLPFRVSPTTALSMRQRFDHFSDLAAFHHAVSAGSFTAAALALGTTTSVISRAIGRLEARVGQTLLRRSTRKSQLTEAGQLYLEQTQSALQLIDDVEQSLKEGSRDVSGRLRISVPTTWGQFGGLRRLLAFQQAHPRVRLEIHMGNRNIDLIADGFDAAIRLGNLPDSRLVAIPIQTAKLLLVASPKYLKASGTPKSIRDLNRHECIGFIRPSTGRVMAWPLLERDQEVEWDPTAKLTVAEDVLACLTLVEHGAGITQSYDFVVAEKLMLGTLKEVLKQTRGRTRTFSLIHASQKRTPSALRALIAFLKE